VRFVEQRGLLYIPVDVMVSGGLLAQQAAKLGLTRIEATATALSGPGPVLDALLSGAADYGTAALPSFVYGVGEDARQRQRGQSSGHREQRCHDALHHQPQRQDARRFRRAGSHRGADGAALL